MYRHIRLFTTIFRHKNLTTDVQQEFSQRFSPILASRQFNHRILRFSSSTSGGTCVDSHLTNTETEDDKIVAEITKDDEELARKLRVLMLEKEVIRQEGGRAPEKLTVDQWKELLALTSRSQRRKFLAFLMGIEKKRENRMIKKQASKVLGEKRKEERLVEIEQNKHITYGFNGSTIFVRIYESTMNVLGNNRLVQAMKFNPKLVVDCAYTKDMNSIEQKYAAKQLCYLFAENRDASEPFDVHFCNAEAKSQMMKSLLKFIPTMNEDWFPMNVHAQSYLDLFPKDKLVYLTPHCRDDMTEFDHDAIYIIGAIVDKYNTEPLSMAKAKSEGIRMKRLPLDRYLQWDSGSGKSLTINQMISILLDLKRTGDWNEALKWVPKRKLVDQATIHDRHFIDKFDKNQRKNVKRFQQQFSRNIDLLLHSQKAHIRNKNGK